MACITAIHEQDDQFHGLKLAIMSDINRHYLVVEESRTQAECFISLDADLQDDLGSFRFLGAVSCRS